MPQNTSNISPSVRPTQASYEERFLKIGNWKIKAQIADTAEKRQLGLSYRDSFGDNEGMLFLMSTTAPHQFWMNEMKIPLDVIWIREGRVVDISYNVLPPTQTGGKIQRMVPKEPADQVLEVKAGFVNRSGIKVGDEVE